MLCINYVYVILTKLNSVQFSSVPACDTWYIPFFGSEIPFLRSKFEFDLYWPSKIQYGGRIEVKYGVWGAHGLLIIFHTLWLLWSIFVFISSPKRWRKQEIIGFNFWKVIKVILEVTKNRDRQLNGGILFCALFKQRHFVTHNVYHFCIWPILTTKIHYSGRNEVHCFVWGVWCTWYNSNIGLCFW